MSKSNEPASDGPAMALSSETASGGSTPGPGSVSAEGFITISFGRADVERYFDDSSLTHGAPPELVVIMGATAVGKTRTRKERYSKGYVTVDAGEVFIALSRGEYIPFPAHLQVPMELLGRLVATRAVSERRNIVVEVLPGEYPRWKPMIDAMLAAGYKVSFVVIGCDPMKAWEWNISRGDDNISSYYAAPYHEAWLLEAARAALNPRGDE